MTLMIRVKALRLLDPWLSDSRYHNGQDKTDNDDNDHKYDDADNWEDDDRDDEVGDEDADDDGDENLACLLLRLARWRGLEKGL